MKSLFFLIITSTVFFINCSLPEPVEHIIYLTNPLKGTWRINGNAFVNPETSVYKLKAIDSKVRFQFGTFVRFDEDGSFHGFYRAQCGNDCFTKVEGTYKFNSMNKITVFIKEINRGGFCNKESEVLNKNMGTFELEIKSKESIFLNRVLLKSKKYK
jgi:hypothetical protein